MAMESTVKFHYACEECRARKLKCSGNRPQCDRCKKDQVTCEYSPQKTMGRPRKKSKPRSPKLSEQQLEHSRLPYVTPEPVPHFRAMHYQQSPEQSLDLGSEWMNFFPNFDYTQIHNSETHCSEFYDPNWSTREGTASNRSLDRHGYDLGNIHAPVPAAPLPNHLVAAHTPELHSPHTHVPRLHISSSPDGSVNFDYPTPKFTGPSHFLDNSPLLPAVPGSSSGSSPATITGNDMSEDTHTLPRCDCIYNLLMSITLLKAHLTKSPIPFQAAICTSRSAIATATYSLSCKVCQSDGARNIFSTDVECISDMFLGALLPMLCIFYTKALESIEEMTGNQKVRIEGREMDTALETWKDMARLAMVKEASKVSKLVDEMGKLSMKKNNMLGGAFCYSADALWEPLCSRLSELARNAKPRTRQRVFAESVGVS